MCKYLLFAKTFLNTKKIYKTELREKVFKMKKNKRK